MSEYEYLLVFAHGIDGSPADLDAVKQEIRSTTTGLKHVELWDSPINTGGRMKDGVHVCATRLWHELLPMLQAKLSASSSTIRMSFIGHSLGGLILRAVLTRMHQWCDAAGLETSCRVVFDSYISIAAPHCGVRALGADVAGIGAFTALFRAMPRGVMRGMCRLLNGPAGTDLLLDNATLLELTDDLGCAALRRCAHRVAATNVSGDWTVPYQSSSLLDAVESEVVRAAWRVPCEREGRTSSSMLSSAQIAAVQLPSTMTATVAAGSDSEAPVSLLVRPLPEGWDATLSAVQHATHDDADMSRAMAAATILQRLRSCGEWQVHAIEVAERASSLLGMRLPHVDIAAIPGQRTSDAGLEVVRCIARDLCETLSEPPLK